MVTRIYTPLQPPINRPAVGRKVGTAGQEETPTDGFDPQRQSRGLATVREQAQTQKINVNTILQDFKSTMGAIGTSDKVRAEVETYLNVVDLQARKDSPSVPLIKQTLKTAADSLDGYITDALGQPSRVVRDWVDALLMQNIHYKYNEGEAPTPGEPNASTGIPGAQAASFDTQTPTTNSPAPSNPYELSAPDKLTLKGYIEKGKSSLQSGNLSEGEATLKQGLQLLENKNRPDLEGKLSHMLGRAFDKAKRPEQALAHYQAAESRFAESKQPEKQSQVLYAMASLLDERGDLAQAQSHYEKALSIDKTLGNTQGAARTLNDLGGLYLRQGNPNKAVDTLKQAYEEAAQANGDDSLIPDIYSNLGGAYRQLKQYGQAYKSYQVSLDRAIRSRDAQGAVATLENMASLSLEAQKPEKALQFLNQAKALKAKFLTPKTV